MASSSSEVQEGMWHQMTMESSATMQPRKYPERSGEPDCGYYLRTGLCDFGMTCRFNHPPDRDLAIATIMKGEYPERVGRPECQYLLKTGICKFGPTCKFHHPKEKAGIERMVQLNTLGYPLRLNEKECAYYLKTGRCKFGDTCKFHHPELIKAMDSSCVSPIYPSLHSSARAGPHSYTGTVASWGLPQASFIASPRWQSPSNYVPMILPQGFMQVPQGLGAQQRPYGISQQVEGSAENQGMLSLNIFSLYHVPQYALQRENVFPDRPDQPDCLYYMKTGDCKFGATCKFHHPPVRPLPAPHSVLNPIGLPLRPGKELCKFYSRYGFCKFGAICKFDHPMATSMGVNASGSSAPASPAATSIYAPVVRRLLGSSTSGSEYTS